MTRPSASPPPAEPLPPLGLAPANLLPRACLKPHLPHVPANSSPPSSRRYTALLWAVEHGYEDSVRVLLDNDANVHLRNNDGLTPLYLACSKGHYQIARALLEAGGGEAMIHPPAVQTHDLSLFAPLPPFAHISPDEQRTLEYALSLAAAKGHSAIVELLLDYGADINTHANCLARHTPLMRAVLGMHRLVVWVLLERGADTTLQNYRGQTALDLIPEDTPLASHIRAELLQASQRR